MTATIPNNTSDHEHPGVTTAEIEQLIAELSALDRRLSDAIEPIPPAVAQVDPVWAVSARNLVQYLSLRRCDIRPLQMDLSELGLSSLGRSEGSIQSSIQSVSTILYALLGTVDPVPRTTPPLPLTAGDALLRAHARALLGESSPGREARIMVTASTELATDTAQMTAMLAAGMNILRINCAHDDPIVWQQLIDTLRVAETEQGRACRILMDLAGPKLRTGPIDQGLPVMRIRPLRNRYGVVTAPAVIWLGAIPSPSNAPSLIVAAEWLADLEPGDRVRFVDAGGRKRLLQVRQRDSDGVWAECRKSAYVTTGTRLTLRRTRRRTTVLEVAPVRPQSIALHRGDELILTRALTEGCNASIGDDGSTVPARIGCTLPEVFTSAKAGEQVWFDDGTIGGEIEAVTADEMRIRITHASATGSTLRAEKGINFPDTQIDVSPLTAKDLQDLAFVVEHADMIGYSFVSKPEDVAQLHWEIEHLGPNRPGIVLKIETRRAFAELPQMLLEAMRQPRAGIMVARGDLAVEVGFQRLAEVQEEILWLAGAGHVPVIWATQVLETLAKTGVPSRSEITDAAMGERAECVMLNKGPYIVAAITTLDDILRRMSDHQRKNRSLLRRLQTWQKVATG